MIMIELEALNLCFQLLLYIYDMISGMSRADVKNVLLIMHQSYCNSALCQTPAPFHTFHSSGTFHVLSYPAVSFQHDPNLDLLWSEKLGYILLSIDTVQDCLYGTNIYTDAQKLARRLFEEVVTDVVLECEDCDDVSSIDDEGREEVKRRWVPFLEMLPEYKSICEDILAGNKDKYSE